MIAYFKTFKSLLATLSHVLSAFTHVGDHTTYNPEKDTARGTVVDRTELRLSESLLVLEACELHLSAHH